MKYCKPKLLTSKTTTQAGCLSGSAAGRGVDENTDVAECSATGGSHLGNLHNALMELCCTNGTGNMVSGATDVGGYTYELSLEDTCSVGNGVII